MFNIEPIKLLSGSHADTVSTGQGCFMNVISYLNGESQITDQSPCVCVTIRQLAIWLNDFANYSQRQRLLPYVLRAMGTATDDKAVIENRLVAVVRFAEFNAKLAAECAAESAKSAKSAEYAEYAKYAAEYAAKYAKSDAYAAEYAAMSAKYAAKYAKSAKSAKYAAKYAAKSAAEYAECAAKYAAMSAKYAAKSAAECAAESAECAKSAATKEAIFNAGIEFLESTCNPAVEADKKIIDRVNRLIELAGAA